MPSAYLRVANRREVVDTGLLSPPPRPRHVWHSPLMDKTPSKPRAALWMAGWLALMLIVAVAGRETTRELNVFEIMEARSVLGFFMLLPLVRMNGGFAAMGTARPPAPTAPNPLHRD